MNLEEERRLKMEPKNSVMEVLEVRQNPQRQLKMLGQKKSSILEANFKKKKKKSKRAGIINS